MSNANTLRLMLAVLTGVALVGALVLRGLGIEANEAWAVVGTFGGLLAGQHLPTPR